MHVLTLVYVNVLVAVLCFTLGKYIAASRYYKTPNSVKEHQRRTAALRNAIRRNNP